MTQKLRTNPTAKALATAAFALILAVTLLTTLPSTARAGAGDATGAPVITGTPQVAQVLTADTFSIDDPDGISGANFSYQWIRVASDDTETDISSATNRTYRLTTNDSGNTIKVKVSFTDDAGNAESLTSAALPSTGTVTTPAGPVPVSASTGTAGTTITVTFNENIATDTAAPPASAFRIKLNGLPVTAGAVNVSGKNVTLGSFAPEIEPTTVATFVIRKSETVTLTYTDPSAVDDAAALQDADGNDTPSFADFPVQNRSVHFPANPERPWDFSATPLGNDRILISWKPGWPNGTELTSFDISWRTEWDGNTLTLTGWESLVRGLAPDLRSYVDTGLKPGIARHYRIVARVGTVQTSFAFHAFAETEDDTGPQVEAITIAPDGDDVHILFDEELGEDVPGPEAFTVKVRSITRPVGNVEHSLVHHDIEAIDQDRHIVLTLDDYVIRQGETVTVSYTDPTTGDDADAVQDDHGNDAPSFTDVPATNLSEIAPTRPSEPTGLSALRDDDDPTTVKLSWNTPERSEGREITGYRIEYRTADIQWTDANPDTKSTDTTWTHPNVPSTGTIKYRVSAINIIATGPASKEARTDAKKPDKPTGLTATTNGLHQIDLSWTMPADQGAGLLGYRIEVSEDGGQAWTDLVANTGNLNTEYSHKGLDHSQTRHYRVSAINALGPGPASDVAQATTIRLLELPALKANEAVVWEAQITAGTFRNNIGYGALAGINSNPTFDYGTRTFRVTQLVLNLHEDGDALYLSIGIPGMGTTREFATPNFKLQVGMQEFALGDSDDSPVNHTWLNVDLDWAEGDVIAVRLIRIKTIPEPPTGLTATTTLQGQIDLSWTAPEDNGGTAITGYKVERSPDGNSNWAILERNTATTNTTYSDETVPAGSTRHYRVSAINDTGTSKPSKNAQGSTLIGDSLPALKANEAVVWKAQITAGKFRNNIGYGALAGINSNPTFDYGTRTFRVTQLVLNLHEDGDALYLSIGIPGMGTTREFATPNFKLQVGMQEFALGDSDDSPVNHTWLNVDLDWAEGDVIAVRLIRIKTIPEPPTGLTATTTLQGQIDLSWTAPEDNGGTAITGYAIEVASDSAGNDRTTLVENKESTGTTYSHTGLPAGATRHYWVSAINETGTGTRSDSTQGNTSGTSDGPIFQSASMGSSGLTIELTFSEDLDDTAANTPPASVFTVKADETTQSISTVSVSGTKVILTLASALAGGMDVTVSYQDPTAINDTKAVQDTDGNDAGSFTDQPVARDKVTLSVNTKSVPLAHTDPDGKTTFIITLPGPAASAVTVPVIITQDQDWLSTSRLNQDVTIAAEESTATLELTNRWFWEDNSAALPSGSLTATLGAVAGYNASGQSQTIYVHGRSQETGTTVLDQTDYSLDEASGDNTIHVVSTLEHMVTPTSLADHSVLISTKAEPDPERPSSSPGRDHQEISGMSLTFSAGDYQLERGRYVARKSFTLTVYDDTFPEEPEYFRLELRGGEDYPHEALPLCVGTTCQKQASDPVPSALVAIVSDDVGAPENLAATAASGSQTNLSWDAPSILGSTDITGYRVEVAESADSTNWAVLTANTESTSTTHSHTGLPPGATRHYRVAAIDDAGAGMTSRTASATTTGTPNGPVFTNAYLAVSRQSVTLKFSENLLETDASLPSTTDFTVKVDGTAVTASSVSVSGSQVLLALASAVDEGATTTVSYADPSTNNDDKAVQDLSGNDAPSFTDQPVAEPMADNDHPGKPTGLAATFDAVEQEMTLTWNTPSSTGGSAITGYKVERSTDNNNWETLEEANSATTYVDTIVEHAKTYHYRVSATNADDETGLPSEVLTVHDQSPPALVNASVPTTGTTVQLQFTEALDDTVTLADLDGSYTVTASEVDVTGDSIAISGSTATITLSTGKTIYRSETVTVSYTDPTTGDDSTALQDSLGNDVASFTNQEVTNNSTVAAPLEDCDPNAAEQLWCATLTVGTGTNSDGDTLLGYHATNSRGTLSPSTFNRGTAAVAVQKLQYTDTMDGNLEFEVERESGTTPAEGLLGTVDLALHVDSLTFSIKNPGTTTSFSFTDHGVTWTEGQDVRVRLTRVPSKPDAPTGLTAIADGSTQIDLSWTPPARNGGKPITGYLVEWSADGATNWTELVASHDGTTYSDTGLTSGTTRHYRVSAINQLGTSTASQAASTTTSTVDTEGPGFSRADVPTAGTSLTVQFNEDINLQNNALPDKNAFQVRVNGTTNPITSLTTTAGVTNQVTLNLTNQIYPGQTVTVDYTDPTDQNDAQAIEDSAGNDAPSFENKAANNGSTVPAPMTIDFTEDTYSFPEEGSGHTVTVEAKTTVDALPNYQPTVTVRTSEGTPSGQTNGAGGSDLDLTDQDTTFATSDFSPEGNIYVARKSMTITVHDDDDVEGTEYFKLTLERPSGLSSAVQLCTIIGCPLYPKITETDTYTEAPTKVTNLSLTPGGRQIEVSWEAAERATGYRVEWKHGTEDYLPERSKQVAGGDNTTARITGLTSRTEYTVRVFATNDIGDGPSSDEAQTTTPQTAVPGPVTNLTVTPLPVFDMEIEWTSPEDTGQSPITGYAIQASYDGTDWETLTPDTGNTDTWYISHSSRVDTLRHFRVQALNSTGPGPWSSPASGTSSAAGTPKPCTREGAVWCGTLTVAQIDSQGTIGYKRDQSTLKGKLWPYRFEFREDRYQVREINFGTGSTSTFRLKITPSRHAFNKTFRLWIGDRKWTFAEAQYNSGTAYYEWSSQGGGQQEGDRLWVELVKDPSPLTAWFTDVPDEHDGESDFNFQVEFSDDITTSLDDFPQAFQVTGGKVTKTVRVNSRKDLWEATVEPDGTQDVTITLPANRPCSTTGAPCSKTLDGKGRKPLSNSPATVVAGPVLVSVTDAQGAEGSNGTVVFIVSLSRAPTGTFTVDYQTQDGTATAGQDYTALEGTISFAENETEKRITVSVVDDDSPEAVETFSLVLSNPSGGQVGTGTATGTITDDDS